MADSFSSTEARQKFSAILTRVNDDGETIQITRRGKLAAMIVPVEDYEYWKRMEAEEDAEDIRAADAATEEFERTGKSITHAQLKKSCV